MQHSACVKVRLQPSFNSASTHGLLDSVLMSYGNNKESDGIGGKGADLQSRWVDGIPSCPGGGTQARHARFARLKVGAAGEATREAARVAPREDAGWRSPEYRVPRAHVHAATAILGQPAWCAWAQSLVWADP
jgi:hypothetical protein